MSLTRDILKAMQLEFVHITASKMNVLLYFAIPLIIVSLFAMLGRIEVSWSKEVAYKTYYDFYAPMIFSTVVYFITLQLTILRIVGERAPFGTLDRELLAVSRAGMFIGKLMTNILIAFFQVFVLFFAGYYVFNVHIAGNPISFLIVMLLSALIGLSIGLCFSVFSKSREQAIQIVPLIILVFLLFSGFLIRLETMPPQLQMITQYMPLYLSYTGLFEISLKGNLIGNISDIVMKLFVWFLIFAFAGLAKFMSEK